MSSNFHTPPADGAPANMSVIRAPLAELDQAITDLALTERDGHIIQDEGVDLAQQQRLNLTGLGVTPTNTVGVTVVDIPALPANLLINGGFDIAQRQAPATLTTIAQDKYSADRWRISRENADLQYQRADGLGEAGLTSQYFGTFKKITNAGKFMVYQIIEGMNSVALRNKTVTFQVKMKASSSKTIRMAVLQLQNAGTIDTIPATFVSAWGSSGVDPTLGANLAIITGAVSKSVTTAMQSFSVTVTVPSNSKNIICAVWTDSQFAVNDTLSIAEAGLFVAANVQAWLPIASATQLQICQRYFQKIAMTSSGAGIGLIGQARSTTTSAFTCALPTAMRITPIATFGTTYISNDGGNTYSGSVTMALDGQSSDTLVRFNGSGYSAYASTGQAVMFVGSPINLEAEL